MERMNVEQYRALKTPRGKRQPESRPAAQFRLQLLSDPEIRDDFRTEYRFHPVRKWRADFSFPKEHARVLVEVDGGTWKGGRHVTGQGYQNDCEKLNEAAAMGLLVIRLTPQHVKNRKGIVWLKRALQQTQY